MSAPYLDDASYVDGFVALAVASERERVDDASLAIAAAEGDDASAMIARVLLAARGYAARAGAIERADDISSADHLEAASRECALLGAAIAEDDEVVVRWLASPAIGLDIAQIRAAQAAAQGAPLRSSLAQSLNSFHGRENRDRALRASRALRAASDAIESAGAALATIVRTAGGAGVIARAAEADLVWGGCANPPPARRRLRILLDALTREDVERATWPAANLPFLKSNDDRGPAREDSSNVLAATDDLQPWEWPLQEPPRAVVSPPMTFSASRLNAFVKCGRRWFFEYLCDAVIDRGSIHATYGKVVHEALEALHRDVREPSAADAAALADRFLREIDAAFGKARSDFATQFEYEVSRLQARRAAPKYIDWLVTQAAAAPMEIIEVETVNRLRAGGHDFIGYIDRVDRPPSGGPVTIFDYKTGRVPDDPREYLEAVRSGEEAQLALYYFMRRARGDEVARVALVSIRDIHDEVRVLALDIVEAGAQRLPARAGAASCARSVLDESLAELVRRCDLLTKTGVPHFEVGKDPPCRYCAYFSACRERPPETESIFVR